MTTGATGTVESRNPATGEVVFTAPPRTCVRSWLGMNAILMIIARIRAVRFAHRCTIRASVAARIRRRRIVTGLISEYSRAA